MESLANMPVCETMNENFDISGFFSFFLFVCLLFFFSSFLSVLFSFLSFVLYCAVF